MRAMFIGMVLSALGAAACGGEIIRYGAAPTPTATPMLVFTLEEVEDETARRDPTSLTRSLDAIRSILLERDDEDFNSDVHIDDPEVEIKLRRWARDVSEGATSRAALQTICRTGLASDQTGIGADARAICQVVRDEPFGNTLRGWADLVEERFGPYDDIRYYDDLFDPEDGE